MSIRQTALQQFDLPEHLQVAVKSVQQLRGLPALFTGAIFALIAVRLAPEVWYFDLQPTQQWIGKTPALMNLPGFLAMIAPIVGWLSWLLPTLLEVGLSRLAREGIQIAEGLAYIAAAFDAMTDWPRVSETMNQPGVVEFFNQHFGAAANVAWQAAEVVLLAFATIGFEALFALSLAVSLTCFLNFRKP